MFVEVVTMSWCRFLDGRVWPLEDELEVALMIDLIRHVTGQYSLLACFRACLTQSTLVLQTASEAGQLHHLSSVSTSLCPLQKGPFVMQRRLHFAAAKLLCNAQNVRCASVFTCCCYQRSVEHTSPAKV